MKLAERVRSIASSVTLDITSKAKKMRSEGIDVVNFGAGEPDFDTPAHIKEAAIQAIKEGFTKYTPSSGTLELREAIAQKFLKDNSLSYSPSQIVVSSGAKHSLYNIFQALCGRGDEVIIPSPYWLSYPEMVKLAEAKSVFVHTDPANKFKVTERELTRHITKRTKALILNSPSNPTGCVYNMEELRFIANLALEHKFFIISDEIYEKLIYDNLKHVSIGSLDKDICDLTITVNGVSKSYSMTGWRIGYAAGPKDIMDAISNLQSHAASNPASISQRAALAAITSAQSAVSRMRDEFEKRRDLMVSRIERIGKIKCTRPGGAFYVFCDISRFKIDSVTFATRLLEEAKVAVVPGAPFGADSFIRLSFVTGAENIAKGIDRIGEWISKNG